MRADHQRPLAAHTHTPPHLFRLDPDIASAFPDEEAVNSALRQFLAEHPRENAG